MDQNFKIVIKIFISLLLLSIAWLTGYFMGVDIGKNKPIISIPENINNANNTNQVLPIVPAVINPGNTQTSAQTKTLPKEPVLINLNN